MFISALLYHMIDYILHNTINKDNVYMYCWCVWLYILPTVIKILDDTTMLWFIQRIEQHHIKNK